MIYFQNISSKVVISFSITVLCFSLGLFEASKLSFERVEVPFYCSKLSSIRKKFPLDCSKSYCIRNKFHFFAQNRLQFERSSLWIAQNRLGFKISFLCKVQNRIHSDFVENWIGCKVMYWNVMYGCVIFSFCTASVCGSRFCIVTK